MFDLFSLGQNFGFPPKQEVTMPMGSDPGSTPSHLSQTSPFNPFNPATFHGFDFNGLAPQLPPPVPPPPEPQSFSASRIGSPVDKDILAPEDITNPLGALSSMAGLVEAAVDRAREEAGEPEGRPMKRLRFSPIEPSGPLIAETQHLPAGGSKKRRGKKLHIHAYPDAVTEGLVSEQEGREMMRMYGSTCRSRADHSFYSGSCNFTPCFDPSVDQWDS
jgi:hypothetical protein